MSTIDYQKQLQTAIKRLNCDYCKPNKEINLIDTADPVNKRNTIARPKSSITYIHRGYLVTEDAGGFDSISIKYCPVCGRKLGD